MRVLVVDDEYLVRRSVARALGRLHWDYDMAAGPLEAALRCDLKRPDVILSDWDMPDGGGAEVIAIAARAGVPIVIYSGGEPQTDRPVIAKPAKSETIDSALKGAIETHARLSRLADPPPGARGSSRGEP